MGWHYVRLLSVPATIDSLDADSAPAADGGDCAGQGRRTEEFTTEPSRCASQPGGSPCKKRRKIVDHRL